MTENSHISVWGTCLGIIRDNITPAGYSTWFEPIKPVSFQDTTLTIEVPSNMFVEYLEVHYLDLISKTLRRVIGPKARLNYRVRIADKAHLNYPAQVASSETAKPASVSGKRVVDSYLNKNYSYENLVEGDCNKLGLSAGKAIAADPGNTAYNPLFLHGGPGLGKTHLSQAIGLEIKNRYPDKNVLYVSANLFMNQYIDAVAVKNKLTDFMHFYQSIDVLIVDDIHEFAEKTGTQNAFFQIFNYLHQSGKQLILTSDRPPVELKGLEQRLLSRFKWGLTAEMAKPDYSTRLAILKAKSRKEGMEFPEEVLEYIARKVDTNVRELEGTIISIMANATHKNRKIDIELAQEVMDKIVGSKKAELSIANVKKAVTSYFGITAERLMSNTRKREIVQARQIAMYLCRSLINLPLETIGKEMGGKNHATVLYACNTVTDLMESNNSFRTYVKDLEKALKNC